MAKKQNQIEESQDNLYPNNSIQNIQSIEDIEKGLDEVLQKHSFRSNNEEINKIAQENLVKTIKLVSDTQQVSPQVVMIAIAEILQSGGHIRGVSIRKAQVGNWEFSKKDLINALSTIRCNCTLRAIARANNKIIAKISKQRKIHGNLFPQYKSYNPKIITENETTQLEHAVYCVDFQKDNQDAPEEVLKFLNQREIDKKTKRTKK
jgi:hypothetical protein